MSQAVLRKLPDGWRCVRLGEVCEEKTGTRDPRSHPIDTFRYVDISSVDNSQKRILDVSVLFGKDAPSRARQVITAEDVIVSTTRPNLNAVALVPQELDNQICSTGFCVLISKKELDCDYLFAYVRSHDFVKKLSDLVKGALYPAVTDKQVKAQVIPLPPLPEQRRIAAILNKQMEAVEKARAAAEAQREAAKVLPEAYLEKVFKSPEAEKWPMLPFGEIAQFKNGINFSSNQKGQGILTVDVLNMYSEGIGIQTNSLYRVDFKADNNQLLSAGDILFVRSSVKREGVAWPALFSGFTEAVTFCGFLIRARLLLDNISPNFLIYYLRLPELRTKLILQSGTGTITNISQNNLKHLLIPIPSKQEQEKIANILNDQMAEAIKLKKSVEDQLNAIKTLPSALLRQAFSGEL